MSKFRKLDRKSKLKILLIAILMIIILIGTCICAVVLDILKTTPNTNLKNLSSSFNQTSSIYDENGKLLEKIESLEYRTIVPYNKVPKDVVNAFISIEDQRFYKHKGVDIRGILGAFRDNLRAGRIVRGGSTITQQLVKNVYLSNVKSINRKVQEAYLALRVENNLTKEEILEAYLNRINLGQGSYGVEAASQTYFSKDVWDLNLAQAALIAGITKSPAEYSPFKRIPKDMYKNQEAIALRDINGEQMYLIRNPKAFERQKIVLKKMLELNKITEKEYKDALEFDIAGSLNPGIKKYHSMSSYSTDYIKSEAARLLADYYKVSQDEAEHKLFTGGYRVYSSLDEKMQKYLEDLYENLPKYYNQISNGSNSPNLLNITLDESDNIIDKNGQIIYFAKNNFFDNEFNLIIDKNNYNLNSKNDLSINKSLFNTSNKKLDLIDLYDINKHNNMQTYNMGFINIPADSFEEKKDYIIIDHNFLKSHKNFYKIDDNDNLLISKDFYSYDPNPVIQPQSSTIVLDNSTGYVKAIVGGLDVHNRNAKILNRAVSSPRAPGSLIKPLSVYLPSLENGKTLGSVVDDSPVFIDGQMYPDNYYKSYYGLTTMRTAIENNSNVAAVKFYEELGQKKSLESLSKLGIINKDLTKDNFVTGIENKSFNDENIDALALGNMQKGITNVDIASAYRTIASGGNYKKISAVIKIEDASGITIIDNKTSEKNNQFDKTDCNLITDALRSNVTRGCAKGASIKGLDTAGEVGINKFNSDLWFTGYTPSYTVSTWFGADSPKIELNSDVSLPINIYKKVATKANNNTELKRFKTDDNIIEKYICQKNGLLGTKLCEESGDGYVEKFKKGTEPVHYCKNHQKALICTKSNRLAGEYCPKEDVEYKIIYDRSDYNPKEHGGIYPDDYEYMPKLYCNIHDEQWYDNQKNNLKNNSKNSNKDKRSSKKSISGKKGKNVKKNP